MPATLLRTARRRTGTTVLAGLLAMASVTTAVAQTAAPAGVPDPPSFEALLAHPVALKPALQGVHPRVFVTRDGLVALRERARTTHRAQWERVLADLPALKDAPPPPPGPQGRRSQNNVAFAIAGVSLAAAVEQKPAYLAAARAWTLAAIDYEPWGYTFNKPNVDLAAGHLLYAIGWAYDLLYDAWTPDERARIRASLERHAAFVYDYFAPTKPGKRFNFTQNHDFIPTSGLAVAALALLGESPDAARWAALARAHHHRANLLLSPDGYYYESMEYWIFSAPWLVHFYDAWEHATGENLWPLGPAPHWKYYLAHILLPDGQNVFDFGDIWEGALTRAGQGEEYGRVFPGGRLQSNFNLMYRVAARLRDPEAQAVAERYAAFGHSNLEEYWTLLWRDATLAPAPMDRMPLSHHFADSGVVCWRSAWTADATAFAFKAGPPEGHRVAALQPKVPEWRLSSGHAHPDGGSFIIWAGGRYLVGDTGYAGISLTRNHNTITIDGVGQGHEGKDHDVWQGTDYATLSRARIVTADASPTGVRITADLAPLYPATAGIERLTRTFVFDGPGTAGVTGPGRFRITDDVALTRAAPIQWYLHADTPFVGAGTAFRAGAPGGTTLAINVTAPAGVATRTAPTVLVAPGQPGSITQGRQDQRGHHLELTVPGARETRVGVTLILERQPGGK